MNNSPKVRSIGILGAAAVAAGGLWLAKREQVARAEGPEPKASTTQPAARSVEVVKPERATMSRKLDVPGTVEAWEQADLYAKVAGYVREVRVDIGDPIKKDQVLAELDVPEMPLELLEAEAQWAAQRAAMGAAEARVVQAQKMREVAQSQRERWNAELALKEITFRRREELYAAKAIPEQEFDEARAQRDVATAELGIAEAKVAAAESDVQGAEATRAVSAAQVEVAASRSAKLRTLMEYARIVAPFDGVVTKRLVDRGALAQAATSSRTTPLFTVQRIDTVRVLIEVPESDLAFVQAGMTVGITPFGQKEKSIEGKVSRAASALNPATRTMRTQIDLPNPDGRLLHGMYVQVVLELDPRQNALTIPATALLTEGKEQLVYTVKDGKAVRTPVKIGLDDGIRLEVTEGLNDDDLVVVTGKGLVTAGASVRPVLKGGS